MDETPSETEVESTAELWWHLFEEHNLDVRQIHGNPQTMHAAIHNFPGASKHNH